MESTIFADISPPLILNCRIAVLRLSLCFPRPPMTPEATRRLDDDRFSPKQRTPERSPSLLPVRRPGPALDTVLTVTPPSPTGYGHHLTYDPNPTLGLASWSHVQLPSVRSSGDQTLKWRSACRWLPGGQHPSRGRGTGLARAKPAAAKALRPRWPLAVKGAETLCPTPAGLGCRLRLREAAALHPGDSWKRTQLRAVGRWPAQQLGERIPPSRSGDLGCVSQRPPLWFSPCQGPLLPRGTMEHPWPPECSSLGASHLAFPAPFGQFCTLNSLC